jgi:hypothetical protein
MATHFFQEEYIKLWAKTKFGFQFAYDNYIDKVSYFLLTLLDMGGGGLIGHPFFQRPNSKKNLKVPKI